MAEQNESVQIEFSDSSFGVKGEVQITHPLVSHIDEEIRELITSAYQDFTYTILGIITLKKELENLGSSLPESFSSLSSGLEHFRSNLDVIQIIGDERLNNQD